MLINKNALRASIQKITSFPMEIFNSSDERIFSTDEEAPLTSFQIIPVLSHKTAFAIHTSPELTDPTQKSLLIGIIKTFLDLDYGIDPYQQLQISDDLRLINLLCGVEPAASNEIKKLASQLNYHYDHLRKAIIFRFDFRNAILSRSEQDTFQACFFNALKREVFLDNEDIFSFIDFEKFIIFKHTDSDLPDPELDAALMNLRRDLCALYDVDVIVGIGSAYNSLKKISLSFDQALFLISYHSLLSRKENGILYIDDYIYEYSSLMLPERYINRKYERFRAINEEKGNLPELFGALSRHNHIILDAAGELGIHRNTLSQRLDKVKAELTIDPLYYDDDRFKVRQFNVISQKKLLLSAGLVIQDESTLYLGYEKFAKLLYENSGGSILLSIHNLSLSGDNDNLTELLRTGSIDFAVTAVNSLNKYTGNRMSTLELPFLFDSPQQAHLILDSNVGRSLMDLLSPAEIVGLGFWSMGWRQITSNVPIRHPDDLIGQKIRIMHNDTMYRFFSLCGAYPIKMKYGHVSLALMQQLIDGQDNPYTNVKSMGFYLYQKYISELDFCYDLVAFMMSRLSWEKLNEEQKQIVLASAGEATKWQRSESARSNALAKRWLLENSFLECISISDECRKEWIERIRPIYDNHPFQGDLRYLLAAKEGLGGTGGN